MQENDTETLPKTETHTDRYMAVMSAPDNRPRKSLLDMLSDDDDSADNNGNDITVPEFANARRVANDDGDESYEVSDADVPKEATQKKAETPLIPPQKPESKKLQNGNQSENADSSVKQVPSDELAVPVYKKEVFAGTRIKEWNDMKNIVQKDPELSPAMKKATMEIFAAEGGMALDANTGKAFAGIGEATFNNLAKTGAIPEIVKVHGENVKFNELLQKEICGVYKAAINDATKAISLGHIRANPGDNKTGVELIGDLSNPTTSHAIVDTIIKTGGSVAPAMIQKALNSVLPPNQKIEVGSAIGSKTYEALKNISKDIEKNQNFKERLYKLRLEVVKPEEQEPEKALMDQWLKPK